MIDEQAARIFADIFKTYLVPAMVAVFVWFTKDAWPDLRKRRTAQNDRERRDDEQKDADYQKLLEKLFEVIAQNTANGVLTQQSTAALTAAMTSLAMQAQGIQLDIAGIYDHIGKPRPSQRATKKLRVTEKASVETTVDTDGSA